MNISHLFPTLLLVLMFGTATSAFAGMNMIDSGGGTVDYPEVHFPPTPAPLPQAPPSGGWVRPFTAGDGGAGVVGGYQTKGGTAVNGNLYVPKNGGTSGSVTVTVPTR